VVFDFAKGATVSVMMLIFVLIASIVYVWSTRHEVRG
jgi:multiple sugar transport system permease protein